MISSLNAPKHDSQATLGFFSANVSNPWDNLMWQGAADEARRRNCRLLSVFGGRLNSPYGFEAQGNILYDLLHAGNIDGLVLVTAGVESFVEQEDVKAFCRRYAPLPLVHIVGDDVPSVQFDDYQAMRELIVHLIEQHAHRRIAFICGSPGHLGQQERYRAYRETLSDYDLPLDPALVYTGPDSDYYAPIAHWLAQIEPHKIDAVVGCSDDRALQALRALQAAGLRVPEDIAVAGFDDIPESRAVTPPLTTVHQPFYDIGRQAVKLLLATLSGGETPERIAVPSTLMLRESCGCEDQILKTIEDTQLLPKASLEKQNESRSTPCVERQTERSASMTTRSVEKAHDDTERRHDKSKSAAEKTLPLSPQERGPSAEFISDMLRAIGTSVQEAQEWIAELIGNFLDDVHRRNEGAFSTSLNAILRQVSEQGGEIESWQNAISVLRHWVLSANENADLVSRTEQLCHQARVSIGQVARRVQMTKRLKAARQAQTLREIEAALITTFEVESLMDVLARELPRLDIPAAYLALYETPHPYSYYQPVPERSRMVLAYHEEGRVDLRDNSPRFCSRQIFPEGVAQREKHISLVLQPLYFRELQIGFAIFEEGPREGLVYDALRTEISSALQGALLVHQVQERSAELARQHSILNTFMANVPDSIYFKDREGRIIRANEAHARQLGFRSPDEEIGKSDFDFFSEKEARRKFEQEQTIIRTGQPLSGVEEQQTWPDGRVSWMLTSKMPLRNEHDDIIGTFGISRDITELVRYRSQLEELVEERTGDLSRSNERLHEEVVERRRAEQALRTGEQQYRLLAESMTDGIAILQQQQFVFANAVFMTMFGYPLNDLLQIDPLRLFPEHAGQAASSRLFSEQNHDEKSQWHIECLCRDGRIIWAEIEQSTIVWNASPALLLAVRDINDRKLRELRMEEERTRLQQENLSLKSSIKERYRFGALVGKSPAIQRIYELIVSAASSDVNVLIVGESGTGKELIAHSLHQVSTRQAQNFVPVNCASIPESLFEREFFGHRKGAFTGADRDKPGFFDRADGGILFLDEVTELSPGNQAKLLRVLQDGEYTPLGSNRPQQAKVLIVAATNKDCREEIAQARLRKDFFYRIGVIELDVPPLRERKEDLPLLTEHILAEYIRKQEEVHKQLPPDLPSDQSMLPGELVQALYAYEWPGNVRELQNVLQRYLVTKDLHSVLSLIAAPERIRAMSQVKLNRQGVDLPEILQSVEKQIIVEALEQNQYRTRRTADKLGITLRTLQRRMRQYRILDE